MSGKERRVNERVRAYWESLRGRRPFPLEAEVDFSTLSDIWDSCFLVEVVPDQKPQTYKYDYLGESLIEAMGEDLTGQEVCNKLVSPIRGDIIEKLDEVIRSREPLVVDSAFTNRHGMEVKYRACLVPLGRSATEIGFILGGMKWKAF